jgi:hypothetical protein
MSNEIELPDFNHIPPVQGINFDGCAWGLFDKNGQRDQLGTLNLLSPARVLKAAQEEMKCGVQVSLNLDLTALKYPAFGRKLLEYKTVDLASLGFCGLDEEISFNPQVGSHWNSLLHFAHQP